jgi:GT2 family glycosyltransferase
MALSVNRHAVPMESARANHRALNPAPLTTRDDNVRTAPRRVTAVILNWNGADLTLVALASLHSQTHPNVRVIVVDNGSHDQPGEVARITSLYPECDVIASPTNLGFAGGCNLGIRAALRDGADYVLLLNNDAVLDDAAVERLVLAIERHPGAGAASPHIYYVSEPDRLWWGGGTLTTGARVLALHDGIGEHRKFDPSIQPVRADWLPATALAVRRAAIEAAGLLDPAYFLYWEDVDWSERIRRAGFELLTVGNARAWHVVNASTGRLSGQTVYYWERSRLRFVERWGSWVSRGVAWGKISVRLVVWRVRRPSNDPEVCVKLAAYRDYLLRRWGPRGERQ